MVEPVVAKLVSCCPKELTALLEGTEPIDKWLVFHICLPSNLLYTRVERLFHSSRCSHDLCHQHHPNHGKRHNTIITYLVLFYLLMSLINGFL
jgi:hypothetical protein